MYLQGVQTLAFIVILCTTHAVVIGLAIKLNGIQLDDKSARTYSWLTLIWLLSLIILLCTRLNP